MRNHFENTPIANDSYEGVPFKLNNKFINSKVYESENSYQTKILRPSVG